MNSKQNNKDNNQDCHVCDKEFVTSEALTDHIEHTHGVSLGNTQTEGVLLTCDKCGTIGFK